MSSQPLDTLLERLSAGDPAAAEEVFRTYEPYLRMVVRRQLPAWLRPKFDSLDVVQSVWADLLEGFRAGGWRFADADHLRAFLVKVTQNRFIERLRQQQRTAADRPVRDDEAALAAPDPRPSEEAQAEDLWQQILSQCPPRHHEVLRLRREGCRIEEIAERTGLHAGSVRRILYDVARRMAALQKTAPPEQAES
jgi:RNA polymerase sigma-70 factor (ECF subfamily)